MKTVVRIIIQYISINQTKIKDSVCGIKYPIKKSKVKY